MQSGLSSPPATSLLGLDHPPDYPTSNIHPYVYVQYLPLAMKHQQEQPMKVNWATSPNSAPKQDTSKHYHIFVGDLSPDIETHQLREAFKCFGEISDCKIIRDPQTLKSRGYGFVSYVGKSDAEMAIREMNGQWLGNKVIRTNWATRKPPAPTPKDGIGPVKPLSFDEVFAQSSPTNTTVYCGGIQNSLTEELVRQLFTSFGTIQEVRVFKDKGYAFVRFARKDHAAQAITQVHGRIVNECVVKCSWGKETGESPQNAQQSPQPQPTPQQFTTAPAAATYQPFYGQVGYWPSYAAANQYQSLSNSAAGTTAAVAAAAAAAYIPQWTPGYSYQGNWVPASAAAVSQWGQLQIPTAQGQPFNGQQSSIIGYPIQQGFQQAQ